MKKLAFVLAVLAGSTNVSYAGDTQPPCKSVPGECQDNGDVPRRIPDWRRPEERHSSAFVCQFEGNMKGLRLGFGFSAQFLGGRGLISCVDKTGRHVHLPVKYKLLGAGPGFDLNWVRNTRLVAAGLGIVASPYDLTGQFSVGKTAGLTFVKRGISVQSAISLKHKGRGISFDVGFVGERAYGLGARLHGMVFWIKPIRGHHDDLVDDFVAN